MQTFNVLRHWLLRLLIIISLLFSGAPLYAAPASGCAGEAMSPAMMSMDTLMVMSALDSDGCHAPQQHPCPDCIDVLCACPALLTSALAPAHIMTLQYSLLPPYPALAHLHLRPVQPRPPQA